MRHVEAAAQEAEEDQGVTITHSFHQRRSTLTGAAKGREEEQEEGEGDAGELGVPLVASSRSDHRLVDSFRFRDG